MPKAVGNVGTGLFDGCNDLCAIKWNAPVALGNAAVDGIVSPNVLLYVGSENLAPSTISNVVRQCHCTQ